MSSTWSNLNSYRINFLNLGNNSVAFNQVNTVIILQWRTAGLQNVIRNMLVQPHFCRNVIQDFIKIKLLKLFITYVLSQIIKTSNVSLMVLGEPNYSSLHYRLFVIPCVKPCVTGTQKHAMKNAEIIAD